MDELEKKINRLILKHEEYRKSFALKIGIYHRNGRQYSHPEVVAMIDKHYLSTLNKIVKAVKKVVSP